MRQLASVRAGPSQSDRARIAHGSRTDSRGCGLPPAPLPAIETGSGLGSWLSSSPFEKPSRIPFLRLLMAIDRPRRAWGGTFPKTGSAPGHRCAWPPPRPSAVAVVSPEKLEVTTSRHRRPRTSRRRTARASTAAWLGAPRASRWTTSSPRPATPTTGCTTWSPPTGPATTPSGTPWPAPSTSPGCWPASALARPAGALLSGSARSCTGPPTCGCRAGRCSGTASAGTHRLTRPGSEPCLLPDRPLAPQAVVHGVSEKCCSGIPMIVPSPGLPGADYVAALRSGPLARRHGTADPWCQPCAPA
jgi:hypothetical protein